MRLARVARQRFFRTANGGRWGAGIACASGCCATMWWGSRSSPAARTTCPNRCKQWARLSPPYTVNMLQRLPCGIFRHHHISYRCYFPHYQSPPTTHDYHHYLYYITSLSLSLLSAKLWVSRPTGEPWRRHSDCDSAEAANENDATSSVW